MHPLLRKAANTLYEHRTPRMHQVILQCLTPHFPTLTPSAIRLLTFFVLPINGATFALPHTLPHNGFLLRHANLDNPEAMVLVRLGKNTCPLLEDNECALLLTYQDYLKCQTLGQTSIESEMEFFLRSEYTCSMARSKHFAALRKSQVIKFGQGQSVFYQGQQLQEGQSGSGVFLVRSGEIHYDKAHHGRTVQTARFIEGHIFGALEIIHPSSSRAFTARAITLTTIVYHFPRDFFETSVLPYCERLLTQKQRKLVKFINPQLPKARSISMNFNLTQSKILPSKTQNSMGWRSLSNALRPSLQSVQQSNIFAKSRRLQMEGLGRTSYLALRNDGPLKSFPMTIQRARQTCSEFRELQKILDERMPRKKITGHLTARRGDVVELLFRQSKFGTRK